MCSVYAPPPPAPRDEAVKVLVAISMPWLHVVTQRAVKGVGKQDRKKTDKTTRTNPEIMGGGGDGRFQILYGAELTGLRCMERNY